MLARKFLYVVAALIVLTLGSAFAYRIWGQRILTSVMVPSARFSAPNRISASDYANRTLWLARPDISATNPSLWLPKGVKRTESKQAAIFYVHPTSYAAPFNIARWNASLEDSESQDIARRFTATQASPFTSVGKVWAPRYHQAHFGAFVSQSDNGRKAVDAAYVEIEAAFSVFLAANPEGPIILAGHSQGSLHLMQLIKNRIAGEPVAKRIVAAYLVGWPVSRTEDMPALGLPECETAEQAGCILSWQSFAEPADTSLVMTAYDHYRGMTGRKRGGTPMLCTNPITGTPDAAAPEKANLGTLAPAPDDTEMSVLVKGAVGATCKNGFLMIGAPPQLGPYVLPGNNYHVYDYALFWANIRRDAEKRLATFLTQQQ